MDNFNITENQWKKNCPKCGREQFYSLKKNFNKAIRLNKICRVCMFSSKEYKEKHSNNTTKMWKDPEKRELIKTRRNLLIENWMLSALPTFNSVEYKKKQCKIQKEYLASHPEKITEDRESIKQLWTDKSSVYYSEKFRENLRNARIEQIKKLGVITSNYNPIACEYFNKLNEKFGWKLQHALNGGEIKVCGYFLDAYDKEKNIIVEYDERHHYKFGRKLRKKDIVRQERLIQKLQPEKFLRYDEEQQNLYSVIVGKEG